MKKLLIVLLFSSWWPSALPAGKNFWETKPFTEWSKEEAIQLITRSPWIKEEQLALLGASASAAGENAPEPSPGLSGGSEGSPRPMGPSVSLRSQPIQITWMGEPVRKAYARLSQLHKGLSDEDAMKIASGNSEVVEIVVEGKLLNRLVAPNDQELPTKTYLQKKSGQQIPLIRATFSKDFQKNPMIFLMFPREVEGKPILTPEDKEVELVLQLGKRKVDTKFKLKDMWVNGAPAF